MPRLVFYNAGPPSKTPPGSANRDLGGLLREYRPRVAIACEAVGDQFHPRPGYDAMVRDRSRAGRANLVAYVRDDCHLRRTWWVDHRTTWSRTNPGAKGQHPARSTMVLGVGDAQVLGGHNVPMGTDNTHAGQLEIVQALHLVMAPWKRPRIRDAAPGLSLSAMRGRPRVLLWDDNAPDAPEGERGLGSEYLAPKVAGQAWGHHIDNTVARNAGVTGVEYVTHAGGVALATDHPWGALVVHLEAGHVDWRRA